MKCLVVYESLYGNTRAIAEAVATGIAATPSATATTATPEDASETRLADVDLLVVGGPTHMRGLPSERSRAIAVKRTVKNTELHLDAGAGGRPLRDWLGTLTAVPCTAVATFDTRFDKPLRSTGSAAAGLAKAFAEHGCRVLSQESFFVEREQLTAGQIQRATTWGLELTGLYEAAFASSGVVEARA